MSILVLFLSAEVFFDSLFSLWVSLNISRLIYLKKIFAHRFVSLICTNKLEGLFFQKKIFPRTSEFFSRLQNHYFGCHFFPQKINFILFFQGWLFNFIIILKTYFNDLFWQTVKNGDFTLLNKPLEPYKLP